MKEKLNKMTDTEIIKSFSWANCPIENCENKVCLALKSDKCFVHTKGNRQFKLLKIWWNNLVTKLKFSYYIDIKLK